jgi:hypothetical protein
VRAGRIVALILAAVLILSLLAQTCASPAVPG